MDFAFFISIQYEKVPLFCSHCQYIGRELSHCSKKVGVSLKEKKDFGKSIPITRVNEKSTYTHLPEKKIFHVDNNTILGEVNSVVDAGLTNWEISSMVVTTIVVVVQKG